MKKIISTILTLTMILSLVAAMGITVAAAPEGTAIKTADEFAAMAADGKYYLDADITINATWNAGADVSSTYKDNTAFTGVLDGNGHTVTISAPLFANLQGTVKNLTTKGELAASELHAGNIAMWTKGKLVIDNVITGATIPSGNTSGGMIGYAATGSDVTVTNSVNKANVTCNGQAGGIIGYCQDDKLTITDCANYGVITTANYGAGIAGRFGRDAATAPDSLATITNTTNYGKIVSAKGQTGGIVGYLVGALVIENCVNYGEIINETAVAGGIYGNSKNTDNVVDIKIKNCINYGAVTGKTRVGGIAGTLGTAVNYDSFRIENCINYGTLTNVAAKDFSSNFQTGGITGYAYGGSKETINGIINCVNAGKIVIDATLAADAATVQVAGIVPYVNSGNWEGKNNVNIGVIETKGTVDAVCLTIYNKNAAPKNISGNYSVAIEGIAVALTGATPEENTALATAVTADKLTSDVLPAVNTAAGSNLFTVKDNKPVLVCNHKYYVEDNKCSACGATVVSGGATTGDSTWVYIALASVALLGTAYIAKKREF